MNVTVNGNKAVALCDSGSQIPIVSSRLLDVGDDDQMGTVNLQGVVGEAVTVPWMSVNVKLSGDEQCEQMTEELQLLCAVVDLNSSSHDVILPVDNVNELRDMPAVNVTRMPVTVPSDVTFQAQTGDVADTVVSDSTVESHDVGDVCDADCLRMSDSVCGADELIAEPHSDARLADCWQQAKVNKGDFVISKGALYHKDKVEGQPICQLCVPQIKCVHVLKLAQNSASDCHLGVSKTPERVRLLTYWPRVCQSMHSYVKSCTSCRLRSRPTKADPC